MTNVEATKALYRELRAAIAADDLVVAEALLETLTPDERRDLMGLLLARLRLAAGNDLAVAEALLETLTSDEDTA
jgi:hypothetical protein